MQHIDETRLEEDVAYRFQYLQEFTGFGADDIAAIHGAAPLLGPIVPTLVDAVYDKLHQYDATWRHFMPRQHGYDGPMPDKLEDLDVDHAQITFRKLHLSRYLEALVTRPYDAKMLMYLDMVGKIHTPDAGNKAIVVPLVQLNALMTFVADALIATICSFDLPRETELATLRAFNKLLWIQMDLISRHYVPS